MKEFLNNTTKSFYLNQKQEQDVLWKILHLIHSTFSCIYQKEECIRHYDIKMTDDVQRSKLNVRLTLAMAFNTLRISVTTLDHVQSTRHKF